MWLSEAMEYFLRFKEAIEVLNIRAKGDLEASDEAGRRKIREMAHDTQLELLREYMRKTEREELLVKLRGDICNERDELRWEVQVLSENISIARAEMVTLAEESRRDEMGEKHAQLAEALDAFAIKTAAVRRLNGQYDELKPPVFTYLSEDEGARCMMGLPT